MSANPLDRRPEFETLQLHAGQEIDPTTRARAVPIYASTSFVFKSSQHAADIFAFKTLDFVYSRLGNPTVDVFEQRMAALEGGVAAVAAASGQSAQFMAIAAIAKEGDNIVSTTYLYGGTYNQLRILFARFGISVKFVESSDPAEYAKAVDEKTKAIFVESVGNPKYNVAPIPELAEVAHKHGIPLIVDNTLGMGGYLVRPIEYGADIVVHSATKWIGGHGTTIGGVVIDSGRFDWAKSRKFPELTEPVAQYHGIKYVEAFGPAAFAVKVRCEILVEVGSALNPFGAFMLLQGLETLSLRAERHSQNALALAQWLKQHPKVAWVSYLGLPEHEFHREASRLFRPGLFGGMVNFGVMGDGAAVVDGLRLATHLANVGDAKTVVIHPATTTHSHMDEDERLSTGATSDLIRVSVGIEHIADIIADFDNALKAVP